MNPDLDFERFRLLHWPDQVRGEQERKPRRAVLLGPGFHPVAYADLPAERTEDEPEPSLFARLLGRGERSRPAPTGVPVW